MATPVFLPFTPQVRTHELPSTLPPLIFFARSWRSLYAPHRDGGPRFHPHPSSWQPLPPVPAVLLRSVAPGSSSVAPELTRPFSSIDFGEEMPKHLKHSIKNPKKWPALAKQLSKDRTLAAWLATTQAIDLIQGQSRQPLLPQNYKHTDASSHDQAESRWAPRERRRRARADHVLLSRTLFPRPPAPSSTTESTCTSYLSLFVLSAQLARSFDDFLRSLSSVDETVAHVVDLLTPLVKKLNLTFDVAGSHANTTVDVVRLHIEGTEHGLEPAPITPTEGAAFELVAGTTRHVFPESIVTPSASESW